MTAPVRAAVREQEERAAAREQVARSRAAQGLPPHIQDEGFLRELAAALERERPGDGEGRGS